MDLKDFFPYASLVVAIISGYFYLKIKMETLDKWKEDREKEDENQWNIITKCREWQTLHEKEAADRRLEIERQLGKLREDSSKVESQLAELLRLVTKLTERFDKWIDKQDR